MEKMDNGFGSFREDAVVRAICELIGTRQRAREISVKTLVDQLRDRALTKSSRAPNHADIVSALKRMAQNSDDCKFIVGRRNRKSRFAFSRKLIEFGRSLLQDCQTDTCYTNPSYVGSIDVGESEVVEHLVSIGSERCVLIKLPVNGLPPNEVSRLVDFIRALAS